MTKDTLPYYTPKEVFLFVAVSLGLCLVFIKLAFKMTTCPEDAIILSTLFVATLFAFEEWGERVVDTRYKRRQQSRDERDD